MLRLLIVALISTLLFFPIAGFTSRVVSSEWLLIVVSFGLAYIATPALLLRLWPAGKRVQVLSMQEALRSGELVTREYEIQEVAEIEECEDEGFNFLLGLSDGETLFLCGQDLYELVERGDFPSTRIRVFSHKTHHLRYGIECCGQRIEHWPKYSPLPLNKTGPAISLEDGEICMKSIPEIEQGLGLEPSPSAMAR